MTTFLDGLDALSDQALLSEVEAAVLRERTDTARVIALLTEVDQRRLYLGEGCASLFAYCTQVLHLSEHAAYGRIEAVRAARRFPIILRQLADGAITLTTVTLIAPHLTVANHQTVLEASRHKSRREVERLVAMLRPLPDVEARISRAPTVPVRAAEPAAVPAVAPAFLVLELALRHPLLRTRLHNRRWRQPLAQWLPRSPRSATRFNARSRASPTTSSVVLKTCSGTPFPMPTCRRSSIGP
jgi:hypothetical protein